jgi:hypothetical protein
MTESADTQPATGFALVEIWKRPWLKAPNCFWREMRPKAPEPWEPELGMKLIHKSGAVCEVTKIITSTPALAELEQAATEYIAPPEPLYIIEWMMGDQPMKGEFYREDLLFRFVRVDRPTTQWEYSAWQAMPSTNAKKALRMGRFMLPEAPGVVFGAREFEGRRATAADYARIAELIDQPGARTGSMTT